MPISNAFVFKNRTNLLPCLFLVLGAALRIFYFAHSAYGVRAHDVRFHEEYVLFVARNFEVPFARGGYEFYQPPAYYFITGLWTWLALQSGMSLQAAYENAALSSVILSCLTLVVGYFLAKTLWPEKNDVACRAAFVALIASFPGLVYLGSKSLNNDYLFVLVTFLFFWQMANFWNTGEKLHWRLTQLIVAIGCLTKGNAVTFLAMIYPCLLFKQHLAKIEKLRLFVESLLCLAVCCGWYVWWRVFDDRQSELIGNAGGFNPDDPHRLPNSFACLFGFNPMIAITAPFNDVSPTHPIMSFWDFLFRSAFFGEWGLQSQMFVPLASVIEILGMVLLLFALAGVVSESMRKRFFLPALIALLVAPLSLWVYRVRLGTISLQDFRYIPIVAIPLFYYAIKLIRGLPGALQLIGFALLFSFVVLCSVTVIVLAQQ